MIRTNGLFGAVQTEKGMAGRRMTRKFLAPLAAATVIWALAAPARSEAPTAFDVAEDPTRFAFTETSGFPATGDHTYLRPFSSRGYVYPAGTLADGIAGVTETGDPAFPEKVIGTWASDGWYVGNGMQATTGLWVVSRQEVSFASGDTLITQGRETVSQTGPSERTIIGGAGAFEGRTGAIYQTLLGYDDHDGASLTFQVAETGGGV